MHSQQKQRHLCEMTTLKQRLHNMPQPTMRACVRGHKHFTPFNTNVLHTLLSLTCRTACDSVQRRALYYALLQQINLAPRCTLNARLARRCFGCDALAPTEGAPLFRVAGCSFNFSNLACHAMWQVCKGVGGVGRCTACGKCTSVRV